MLTVFTVFRTLLLRDLTLAYRHRADYVNPLVFFVIVVTLFPLGLDPQMSLLQRIAPGVIWVAALLASMLSLDGLFRADFEDGSLEQMVLSPHPLTVVVLAKVLAHWLASGVPLLLLSPLLGVLLHLDGHAISILITTLALGTPVLSLIGAIGGALTVTLKRGGILLSLIVLPLYIPVLIFAASAVAAAGVGVTVTAQLYMLGGILVLALTLAPLAVASALRISFG